MTAQDEPRDHARTEAGGEVEHPLVPRRYTDAAGREQRVADETRRWIEDRIGDLSVGADAGPIVVRTEAGVVSGLPPGQICLEDGSSTEARDEPVELPFGYHRHQDGEGHDRALIVCPPRCQLPVEPAWGWAVQLYATRSRSSWGIGDLGDLDRLAQWSRTLGAGFVLVNPLCAGSPQGPQQPSPYYPGTRRFRSPLYLDVGAVPGADAVAGFDRAASAGRALDERRTIDRDEVWALKRGALEAAWRDGPADPGFEAWYPQQSASLHRWAAWCATADRHGSDWRRWPGEAEAAARSATGPSNEASVRFHAWLQWIAEVQLGEVSQHIAVVQDLPIGVDPGGFDAWEWAELLALDVSVGAPPDEFNQAGQDWGLPPFLPDRLRTAEYQPFIESIRASMATGGGLRIDHVMGLFRLWWIPEHLGARDGAYVRYPADDLLAIVALESHRAQAVIVGEDLGTVEDEVRRVLADHDVLSYRLLWFEEDDPETWPERSLAAVTTHDLPTVAGLWTETDLEEQVQLGLDPNVESTEGIVARLRQATALPGDAPSADAVVAAHRMLRRSPSLLAAATLDDALGVAERPNIPGADHGRPNWSLALPRPLDDLMGDDLVGEVAAVMATEGAGQPPTLSPSSSMSPPPGV